MSALPDRKGDLDQAAKVMKWCLQSESAKHINAALDLSRSEAGIPILPEQMDRNPWLLNCPNGTVDLRTGKLGAHCREDNITKLCPTEFHEDAACPVWERFLLEVFKRDKFLVQFVQRLFGYCLTGLVSEQILPIFHGGGANGKSTMLTAVLETMGGDYSMKASQDLLMVRRGERHPTELASLFGMRLVVASETTQGGRLNEALVKDLTGGEKVTARRMREDFWSFDPTHKVILQTNHRPKVSGTDHAIWRRLRLVPFEVAFWDPNDPGNQGKDLDPELKQDKDLTRKLRAEYPGILVWMLVGCLDWQQEGLLLPDKVRTATQEYREDQDIVSQWLEECCILGDAFRQRSSDLYASYRSWCERNCEAPIKQKPWGDCMTERKFRREKSNVTWYGGLALQASPEDERRSRE
jgi:putative DNA primase/helicase